MEETKNVWLYFGIGSYLLLDIIAPAIAHNKELVKLLWILRGLKWLIIWSMKKLFKNNFFKTKEAAET